MYKSTPITKKAGSPLYNVLVEGNKDMHDKSTKKPIALDLRTTKDVEKGTEGTPSTTTTVEREKPQVGGYRRACGSKNDGSTGTDPETGDTFVCKQAEKGKEPEEMEKVEVTTPGTEGTPDKTTYLDTQIMEATTQNVLGDQETRELGRTVKKTGKDARRAIMKESRIKNKQAKFDKKYGGKELKPGDKGYRKQQRLSAKATETEGEREAFENAFKNAQSNRDSGRSIGSSIAGEDRMRTQGQQTPEEQIANNKIRQERDNETGTTTPEVNYAKYFADKAKSLNTFKLNYSPANMRAPLKKNYFKK